MKSERFDVFKAVPIWFPVGIAVLAFIFGAGGTYAISQVRMNEIERVNEVQDKQIKEMRSSIDRIDRNLIRIGSKLGIDDKLERP
jgi:hypothetical protein